MLRFSLGSPIREWTFIESNEIAESAGAVASNGGAIPKKTTPPPSAPAPADPSNANTKVDYAELSRLLSTHIVAQNQAMPSTSAQPDAKAQGELVTDSAAKSAKTPPPTPMHPGPYIFCFFFFCHFHLFKMMRV